jgi:aminoglycoside phosphotransferase (APT) family kinase protein
MWLKQVPPFMHESRVLRWLNRAVPGAAPVLLAADDEGRSLLEHIAGDDLYGAPVATRHRILERLHDVQRVSAEAMEELMALGVPDRRGERAAIDVAQWLSAWSPDHPGLAELLLQYRRHQELLDDARLPATLVHGDMHPGNARGSERAVTLLDWGEVVVGNPATDIWRLVEDLSPSEAAPLIDDWCSRWKAVAPRSKPELALAAAPFVAAMRGAASYAHFLQQIEETEWPYHQSDVPRCLATAATLLR